MKHYFEKIVGIGLACVCAVSLAFFGKPIESYADSGVDLVINGETEMGVVATYIMNDSSERRDIAIVGSASKNFKSVLILNETEFSGIYTGGSTTRVTLIGSRLAEDGYTFPISVKVVVEPMSDEIYGSYTYNTLVRVEVVELPPVDVPIQPDEKAILRQAVEDGREEEITFTGISTIDREMNNILKDSKADVILKFQYEGVPHEVLIPAGEAPTEDLDFFGPCWLLGRYGDLLKTPEPYIIKKGDTLKKLADRWGVSVGYLMRLNPYIRDNHWIYAGDTLMH